MLLCAWPQSQRQNGFDGFTYVKNTHQLYFEFSDRISGLKTCFWIQIAWPVTTLMYCPMHQSELWLRVVFSRSHWPREWKASYWLNDWLIGWLFHSFLFLRVAEKHLEWWILHQKRRGPPREQVNRFALAAMDFWRNLSCRLVIGCYKI